MYPFVCGFAVDILCLSETWLSDYIFDNETLPAGYTIYQRDRLTRGGGVLVTSLTYMEPAVIEALRVHSASDCPMSTDHFMLSFGLQGEASLLQHSPCTTSTVVFNYSKANWEGLCNYLLDQEVIA